MRCYPTEPDESTHLSLRGVRAGEAASPEGVEADPGVVIISGDVICLEEDTGLRDTTDDRNQGN